MPKKKDDQYEQRINELTQDLQRMRADFENYRKRVDSEKEMAKAQGKIQAISIVLPVMDNIERALTHKPKELEQNAWADGVQKLTKNMDAALQKLDIKKMDVKPGDNFDPSLHDAIQFDESDGETETIAEVLQSGYYLKGEPMRHAMVRVTRK